MMQNSCRVKQALVNGAIAYKKDTPWLTLEQPAFVSMTGHELKVAIRPLMPSLQRVRDHVLDVNITVVCRAVEKWLDGEEAVNPELRGVLQGVLGDELYNNANAEKRYAFLALVSLLNALRLTSNSGLLHIGRCLSAAAEFATIAMTHPNAERERQRAHVLELYKPKIRERKQES